MIRFTIYNMADLSRNIYYKRELKVLLQDHNAPRFKERKWEDFHEKWCHEDMKIVKFYNGPF